MNTHKIKTVEGYNALRFPYNDGYVNVVVYVGRMKSGNEIWRRKYKSWVTVQQIEDDVYQVCVKHKIGGGLWFK